MKNFISSVIIFVSINTAFADDEAWRKQAWVEQGKDSVRAVLKDGDSAKFQNVYFFRGKDNIPVACGEVNSKNSFGAYGGYQKFISAGSVKATFLQEQVSDFYVAWNKLCTK